MSSKLIDCVRCTRRAPAGGWLFGERICSTCIMRVRRNPEPCSGCEQIKVVAFLDAQGQPRCATCAGVPAKFACITCGSEENLYGRSCGPCTLKVRATELLTDQHGQIHPQLRPVFDALVNVERAQTVLWWFHHSKGGPDLLRKMAQGEVPISHAAFAGLPADRATQHIRDLLAAHHVLPAYHPQLERMVPWLAGLLPDLPKDQSDVLDRYAKWHVLRRLRLTADRGNLTRGVMQAGRSKIRYALRFFGWLTDNDLTLDALTQTDIDRYLSEQPRCRSYLRDFLTWTHRAALTGEFDIPRLESAEPAVTLSDAQRWTQVELLLHDETIRLYARVAGLLTLLFAQPLARVVRLRASQIEQRADGTVAITLDAGASPVVLPEILEDLVREQLKARGLSSFPNQLDPWLFPGGVPGRHIVTECVRAELVANGIHPRQARLAALFQLAGQMPTPVLADLLGISTNCAARWAALASKDWSRYTADRSRTRG